MRREVARAIRGVFNAPDKETAERALAQAAERRRKRAPRLAAWLEETVPEALAVVGLPEPHRRLLRTANSIGKPNKQIKRRTSVAALSSTSAPSSDSSAPAGRDQRGAGSRTHPPRHGDRVNRTASSSRSTEELLLAPRPSGVSTSSCPRSRGVPYPSGRFRQNMQPDYTMRLELESPCR